MVLGSFLGQEVQSLHFLLLLLAVSYFYFYFYFLMFYFIFKRQRESERERERERMSGEGQRKRGTQNLKQAPDSVSTEPDVGLKLMSCENMT